VACWELPEDPIDAGQARADIRHQLPGWQLDDLVMTTELIASELVGNVIRHAKGPIRLRLIRSRSLIREVADAGLTTPHIRRALDTDEGGRGLRLATALSQRWGTRYSSDGKCIWTEQFLPWVRMTAAMSRSTTSAPGAIAARPGIGASGTGPRRSVQLDVEA
jgi:anti-sigma regulatory factor (Ser/Thr protein kinase)